MADVVAELSIERPPDAVWPVLADFGAISRWAPNVDHSCLTTEQTEGEGTVRRVQVGRNALLERVVRWEPDRRLDYAIEGLPPLVRSVTNSWALEGSGSATTVRVTSHVDAGSRPPQKLAAGVVARMLARASEQMLQGLKAHLEQDSP